MTTIHVNPSLTATCAAPLCAHCSLPVPTGLVRDDAEHQFCCHGCESVYAIIRGEGLDRYYDMRRQVEKTRAPVADRDIDYAAFDDPAFVAQYVSIDEAGLASAMLTLDGLHCLACVWLVERLPRVVPGVVDAAVSFSRATVHVRWDPERASLSRVARGLHSLGYPASPPRGQAQDRERRLDARRQLIRIGVAGALAGNIMLVSVALYAGVFEGIEAEFFTLFRWISAVLCLISLAWPGRVFFRGALASIRTRTPHLDLPIAIALAAGGAWGMVNTVRGSGEIYFDSLATLVFFLLAGRFLQSQQQRRAADAVDLLLTLTPGLVRIVRPDGTTETRPVEAVQVGDAAEIRAGETVPVDGLVDTGVSEIDQAILTGESLPTPVRPGSEVWAGAVNLVSTLRVRVTAVGDSTRAAKLMRLVADAMETKAPIVHLADRIAGVFVVVVTTLAVFTGIAWAFIDPTYAMDHATALLIVTCPCALGLATPLVLSAGIGRLASRGILVKGGQQLERLSVPGEIYLDKTGTLTTGVMSVAEWTVPEDTRRRVRALEAGSTHPIARAIAGSGPVGPEQGPAFEVESNQVQGAGAEGIVDGVALTVGTRRFLESRGIDVGETHARWAAHAADEGLTPVLIAEQGRAVGGVALSDTLRPEASELVGSLRRAGWKVGLLSGDDERVVRATARAVGIDPELARGRVSPEDKLAAVRSALASQMPVAKGRGSRLPVVMVGDGVNDAAALAAADVGIAVQGGADASLDAAGVSIQRGGLDAVTTLINASRGSIRRIRMCMAFSLTYNAAVATLAIVGLIHPLLAAVVMPLSSLTVVTIAASPARAARTSGDVPCRSS